MFCILVTVNIFGLSKINVSAKNMNDIFSLAGLFKCDILHGVLNIFYCSEKETRTLKKQLLSWD